MRRHQESTIIGGLHSSRPKRIIRRDNEEPSNAQSGRMRI